MLRTIAYLLLWGLVLMMPWEEMGVIGETVSVSRVLGYALLVAAALALAASPQLRPVPMPMIYFVLFIGWCALSSFWSIVPEESVNRAITNLMLLGFIWMVWEFAPSLRQQQGLLMAYLLGCIGPLLSQFHAIRAGESHSEGRVSAEAVNENSLAVLLVLSIAVAFYFASNRTTVLYRLRLLFWAYIPFAVIGTLFTGSRGGLVCLGGMGTATLVMLRRVNWKVALLFLIVAGGLGYVAPKLLPEQLSSRLTEGTKAHTFTGRVEIWQAGLRGWLESPLLGYGTGSYPEISQRNGSEHMVAHNTWINVLVEVGFIGLFLFMLIWITVLWRIWRAPRLEQMLCAGLVASYLPITISGSQEYQKILWLIFILILSLTAFPATSSQSPPAGTAVPYQRPRLGNTGG